MQQNIAFMYQSMLLADMGGRPGRVAPEKGAGSNRKGHLFGGEGQGYRLTVLLRPEELHRI
jgi:hypothetical protein